MDKKTKIICSIGPTSLELETLDQMFQAGMNCIRINTAYGDFDRYKLIVNNVQKIADIPVMVDLKGPEIRLQSNKELVIKKGDVIDVGFNSEKIRFNHDFINQMNVGESILIDNGRIKTSIIEKIDGALRLYVIKGGMVSDGKGVNIPNKQLNVSTLSPRDLRIIEFAKELEVDFFALSFTRKAEDIIKLKSAVGDFRGGILAKIENSEGIKNFDEIMNLSDGIMIARGDLGVELNPERVPLIQKSLIRKCNQSGKTVVTATEMLESMMYQSIPTRAEVSDVANAILDGTDATMLSGETAVGENPVEVVAMLSRIAKETEKAVKTSVKDKGFINISDTISKSIQRICQNMPLTKIVTLTRSGYTAKMISRFKVLQPIIAVTPDPIVKKHLELVYGVIPVNYDYQNVQNRLLSVTDRLYSMKLLDIEDTVLFTAAFRTKKKHASNLIEIHTLNELLDLKKKDLPN